MIKELGGVSLYVLMSAGFNSWSVPLFGVPLTVLAMSVGGAALGASYGKPAENRIMTVITHAFLATVCVAVLPRVFGWGWATPALEGPLAGLLSFSARFAIPAIPWGEIVRKVFKLGPKQEG